MGKNKYKQQSLQHNFTWELNFLETLQLLLKYKENIKQKRDK